jgi:hypothetical protein
MKNRKQIELHLAELKLKQEDNFNRDVNWSEKLNGILETKIKLLEWVLKEDEEDAPDEICDLCRGTGKVTVGTFDDHITKKCPDCSFEDMSGSDNEDR